MAEYIDRKKAIKEIINTYEHEFPTASGAFDKFATKIVPSVLKNIPTAEVAPVRHGRWLPLEGHWDNAECSTCGEVYTVTEYGENKELFKVFGELYSYCPNCGAKMDGGDDDAADNG